jgi:hypothetical protein
MAARSATTAIFFIIVFSSKVTYESRLCPSFTFHVNHGAASAALALVLPLPIAPPAMPEGRPARRFNVPTTI